VKISCKMGIVVLTILLLISLLLVACGSENKQTSTVQTIPTEFPTSTEAAAPEPESIVITIGNLTDMTGVAANGMAPVNMALGDTISYYNDQNFIPGVKLKVITYDGQYDPARDIPGYEWIKERGADFIFSPVAATAITLKPRLEEDKMVLFAMSPSEEAFVPPGWVFAMGNVLYSQQIYTLLKWVAENDPDFPQNRPARIGGTMWNEPAGVAILGAAEKYAKTNPDQYEWEGGYTNKFSFVWTSEVEALKDCDYVFPPIPLNVFVKAYRDAGYTAKFLGTDAHIAFMGQIDDEGLWDEVDGMLVVRPFRWWNEEGELVDLTKKILYENHPDDAEDIIRRGVGYITVQPVYMILEAVRETVEEVGPQNFNSEALYNTLQSFSITVDGCHHSFSEIKRTSNDYLNIDELRSADKDLFRVDPEWLPLVSEP